jgi:hypothetical protein
MARFTLKGWNLADWFAGNGKTIKEIFKVGVPILVGWVTTHSPVYTTLITLVGKLVLDTLEYFVKE